MKSYLKTLIFFPLILQVIVTALLIWFDDDSSGVIVPFSSYALTAFLLATIPAFLTALLANTSQLSVSRLQFMKPEDSPLQTEIIFQLDKEAK